MVRSVLPKQTKKHRDRIRTHGQMTRSSEVESVHLMLLIIVCQSAARILDCCQNPDLEVC